MINIGNDIKTDVKALPEKASIFTNVEGGLLDVNNYLTTEIRTDN